MPRASRQTSRPTLAAATLAFVAIACLQVPALSQSPSLPPPSVDPAASAVPVASAAVMDVAAIEWTRSRKAGDFDPARNGNSPLVFDLAKGPDGRLLLVGGIIDQLGQQARAAVWGSDDGARWTRLKGSVPKGSSANAIVATDDGFLIGGDVNRSDAMLITSDGTKLSKLDAPGEGLPTGTLFALERAPFGLVAAGEDAERRPTIWTSTDEGVTWTGTPIPDAAYVIHLALTDDGTVVALGTQGDEDARTATAWTSTDGVTWTASAFPVEPTPFGVPDLERTPVGLIATIGGDGPGAGAWPSTGGVTWTHVLASPGRKTVGTAGTEAILFGRDGWWHSPDGITWTEVPSSWDDHTIETSVIRDDGAVIAAGYQFGPPSAVRTWIGMPPTP
jgi:hypothetical protein